jgi:hypothetical protein
MIADSPSVPPISEFVRTMTHCAFAPWASQPGEDGQYFRPLIMKLSPSRCFAVVAEGKYNLTVRRNGRSGFPRFCRGVSQSRVATWCGRRALGDLGHGRFKIAYRVVSVVSAVERCATDAMATGERRRMTPIRLVSLSATGWPVHGCSGSSDIR